VNTASERQGHVGDGVTVAVTFWADPDEEKEEAEATDTKNNGGGGGDGDAVVETESDEGDSAGFKVTKLFFFVITDAPAK
jgi:hypothetical protein